MKFHKITKLFEALPWLKQNDVAHLCSMSPQHLSSLTKGRKKPTEENIKRINEALDFIAECAQENKVKA